MIKVLHIVENFDGQAIERWLTHLTFESINKRSDIDWSFFCILQSPGKYSEAIFENGGKVICSPYTISKVLPFLKNLRRVIKEGNYDVLHCHHDIMSGLYLLASIGIPLRKRIVHVHNTSSGLPTTNPIKSWFAGVIFKWICFTMADRIVGVSRDALNAFSGRKSKGGKYQVVHCGFNLLPFSDKSSSQNELRKELGIYLETKILLFVGRMITYKNPFWVLEILRELVHSGQNVYAVFAGDGPLVEQVRNAAQEMNLLGRIRLLGNREDVPLLMKSSDILVCPSVEYPKEGLGLVIVEAQAAGLPVLMSKSIPDEAVVVPDLVKALPLTAGLNVWTGAVVEIFGRNLSGVRERCLEQMGASSFSISNSFRNLRELYK